MRDGNHLDDEPAFKDSIDDSVLSASGGVERGKRLAQRLSDAMRVLAKCTHHELECGGRDLFGQLELERAPCRSGEDDLVGPLTH